MQYKWVPVSQDEKPLYAKITDHLPIILIGKFLAHRTFPINGEQESPTKDTSSGR